MPRTSNSIYACVIRFLLSQKYIRQTRTDRTLQDGEEPSKNQVSKIFWKNGLQTGFKPRGKMCDFLKGWGGQNTNF